MLIISMLVDVLCVMFVLLLCFLKLVGVLGVGFGGGVLDNVCLMLCRLNFFLLMIENSFLGDLKLSFVVRLFRLIDVLFLCCSVFLISV